MGEDLKVSLEHQASVPLLYADLTPITQESRSARRMNLQTPSTLLMVDTNSTVDRVRKPEMHVKAAYLECLGQVQNQILTKHHPTTKMKEYPA